jgi:hypothetical protein
VAILAVLIPPKQRTNGHYVALSIMCNRLRLAYPCKAYGNLFRIIPSNAQDYLMRLRKLPSR